MRRLLAIGIIGLLISLSVGAQTRLLEPQYYLGLRGGISAATVYFTPVVARMDPIYNGCILAPEGGIAFRYMGHKHCGLQLEADYQQIGWREHGKETDYVRRLHYIEVPFLMHLCFGKKGWNGIFNLGPEVGYCFRDDMGNGNTFSETGKQYEKTDKPIDWGVAGGLGFNYTHRFGILELEARFQYSLGTIFGNKSSDYFSGNSNPMILSLNLAYLFRVK